MTLSGSAFVSDFTSDGQLSIPTGGTINDSFSPIVLGGGSTTTIASGGTIFLNGQTLELRGALLVNNGHISIGTTNVNFGSLPKGSGVYAR